MNKKRIIISVIAVAVVAAVIACILIFVVHPFSKKETANTNGSIPGSTVSADKTPSLNSCTLVSKETMTSSLGKQVTSIGNSSRQGVIANTGKIAESCDYTFKTAKSDDNSLSFQTYVYDTTSKDATSKEVVDKNWVQLAYATLPSYYHQDKTSDGAYSVSTLRVITGPYNYLFIMRQPVGKETFSDPEIRLILVDLSSKANFAKTESAPTTGDKTDSTAPPAPNVPITQL